MIDTNNQETGTESETGTEEGTQESEVVTLKKEEHAKLNETIGSLKRELKELKKAKAEETSEKPKLDSSETLQKLERMALRQAGLTHQDDIELAKTTAKKWGMDIDEVIDDPDFKTKLERQQTTRSNLEATANIKGSGNTGSAKDSPEYWQAKREPPMPNDVPDKAKRQAIIGSMMKNSGSSKVFYND